MAPGLLSTESPAHSGTDTAKTTYPKPLQSSGSLEQFSYEDTTPAIGREFFKVNIVDDLIKADNADALLRDLAITSTYNNPALMLQNLHE